jgi:hypothetical protein
MRRIMNPRFKLARRRARGDRAPKSSMRPSIRISVAGAQGKTAILPLRPAAPG